MRDREESGAGPAVFVGGPLQPSLAAGDSRSSDLRWRIDKNTDEGLKTRANYPRNPNIY